MDLNELRTWKEKIDVYLKEQGWDVTNRASVIPEVDTKQSDCLARSYKTVAETLKNDLESKYVDYLLLDSLGAPLATVEAKHTAKDSLIRQKQAERYTDDIKWVLEHLRLEDGEKRGRKKTIKNAHMRPR